ncbi:hypothetical protein [Actinokineospora pegani]|uniref:hypothetical protein n=1 Tax=Actinokineospora pegani TaxID=2654637 RepID=UPI0012E9B5F5|nr:hypothetical protein [Actinokineospora pegani]
MSEPQHPGRGPWPGSHPSHGETDWIPRVSGGDPFQFSAEPPPPPPNTALSWGLRIAGLIAIAVVSGLVWSYVTSDGDSADQAGVPTVEQTLPKTAGKYQFDPHPEVAKARTDTDCAKHAYGATREFLARPGLCTKVVQGLFTTTVENREILVSVGVLHFNSAKTAGELRALTDRDGTGNVNDLVRDKVISVPPLTALSGGGYAAQQNESVVVIVEADYAPVEGKATRTAADEPTLKAVCGDALRLALEIDAEA